MQTVLQLDGLDCAVCAAELEEEIQKIEGVRKATVAFATQKLSVEYEDESVLERVLYAANHFEEVHVVQEKTRQGEQVVANDADEHGGNKRREEWCRIFVSALCLGLAVLFENVFLWQVAAYVGYAAAYFAVAYPVLWTTVKNVGKGKIFDENFLMTIASIGAIALGELTEGVAVMLLYQIGETLQAIAVGSSRRSITELMDLKSEYATKLVKGEPVTIAAEEVQRGDVLLVKAGEKVPVDGCLLSSSAVLDTKSLTGESQPKTIAIGGELLSGCVNVGEVFKMQALRAYEDSAAQRVLQLVENAASGKAKPEKFITKFAKYYTPIICAVAAVLAVLLPLFDGYFTLGYVTFYRMERWLRSALTFLVVSCPCALVVSVPLTYFSGIGCCAKGGVLVKGATYLDMLAQAKSIAFDKTGTLTEGNFAVLGVRAYDGESEEYALALAAAVEKNSAHPIAKAFRLIRTQYKADGVTEIAGKGMSAIVDGATVLVGNGELLKDNAVPFEEEPSVYTLVYVAKNGVCLARIELGDQVRENAKTAVRGLNECGYTRTVMLTGDTFERAKAVAEEIGIEWVEANLLPDEKLALATAYKADGKLVYVGDGINDAPVMAASDCAVSMGKLGSAAAVEASDLVLISDDLNALVFGVKVAKKTRKIVFQNILFSLAMKLAFMVLGAMGVLPLWLAVFADVGVMLLAVLNSFRVRRVRDR